MATPIVVASSTVNGNIGSCSVQVSNVSVSSFYTRAIATNSCTGEIISDHTYYDWGYVYVPSVIMGIILFIAILFAAAVKY